MKSMVPGYHPFWFWNDRLSAEEIRWQIGQMHEQGIKGFYIHSRQGLKQPYLGDIFFDMVEVAVAEAEKFGMTVQIYDEYPYPSGIAGGRVTLGRPDMLATSLVQVKHDVSGGGDVSLVLPKGHILDCQAFSVTDGKVDWNSSRNLLSSVGTKLSTDSYMETGLTDYNRKRYFASDPEVILETTLPDGEWRIYIAAQCLVDDHKYWGNFADIMQPEVVETFLQETHDRYKARLGDKFGSTIVAVFVDETAPSWTPLLPELFRKRWGHDLLPFLPALADKDHPNHVQTRHELTEVQYECFCENFEEPILDWCRENKLMYGGEKPTWKFSQLRYMDIPGCEPGHVKSGAPLDLLDSQIRQNAKAAASAAFFYDKKGAQCECYHSIGWSGNLQDAKRIAEGLMLCGIDFLVPHGFFYSTHGLRKHDAPPSWFYQMPSWPLFGELSKRLDNLQSAWNGMRPAPQVLLVDPNGLQPTEGQLHSYSRFQQELMSSQIEFLLADQEIIESGEVRGSRLHVHDAVIQAVIFSPAQHHPDGLDELASRLSAKGLSVYYLEEGNEEELAAKLYKELDIPLRIKCETGNARYLWMCMKANSHGTKSWFLLNTDRYSIDLDIQFPGQLKEIPLEPHCPTDLRYSTTGWTRHLEPHESIFLLENDKPEMASHEHNDYERIDIEIPETVSVCPCNHNLLRLGIWDLSVRQNGGDWSATVSVPAMPLANQLKDSGLKFYPNFNLFFGNSPKLSLPRLEIMYSTSFICNYPGQILLVMEPDSIQGDWKLICNGSVISTESQYETNIPVRGCLALDITSMLKQGENHIQVELSTDKLDGGLLSPLFLAGDFAVFSGPTLTLPCKTGCFDDYEGNGLPYFTGTVEYGFTAEIPADTGKEGICLELHIPDSITDAVELALGNEVFRPLPWNPRRILIPKNELHENVRLRLHTSLIRAFEGDFFNQLTHKTQPVVLSDRE